MVITSVHFSGGLSSNFAYGSLIYSFRLSAVAKKGLKFYFRVFLSLFATASSKAVKVAFISFLT